jgi:hypothetical protein
MRRHCRLVLASTLVASALAVAGASTARGEGAADDVSLAVGLEMSQSPSETTSLNFKIFVEVSSAGGVEQRFTATIRLPAGLRWGADGPDPSEGCSGTEPAVCTQTMQRNQAGTVAGGWTWDVVAERAGAYEITATVQPERPDPNVANNTSTLRFEVRPRTSGGGGTASGVAASSVKLVPTRPRAGSVIAASVRVSAAGTGVRPSNIRCRATVGGAGLPVTARAGVGIATCLVRSPKTAKGKTLRGTISFAAAGRTFTRRFAARLA